MPQVVSDPSLNPGIILNGGTSLFAYPDTPTASILDFQTIPSQPLPPQTATATGMLSPDLLFAQRLRNFPPEVYDLSPSSVLVHFMQALLGDGGAGQVRKRQLLARLQTAVSSTSFYDLDAFYGALFGAIRGPSGTLPVNPATGLTYDPYSDTASQDVWDEIEAIDARFRERIIALARAITLGGTVPGLRALAEAVAGVPCDVWEIWSLIDRQGAQGSGNLWSFVESTWTTWDAFPGGFMWEQVSGFIDYGGLGINSRSEVIIQPRKNYDNTVEGLTQRAADLYGISRVCETLQPATCLLTVNDRGLDPQRPVPIAALWADSTYWDVVQYVTPPVGPPAPQPRPPHSRHQGTQISYVADVTTARGIATDDDGDFTDHLVYGDHEQVIFPGGKKVEYTAAKGVMEKSRAASSRLASQVSVVAAPYSGPRLPVATAG
jgi:hypothetical protein